MITNLFSIFDPSTFSLSLFSWLLIFFCVALIIITIFSARSNLILLKKIITRFVSREVKPLIGNNNYNGILVIYLSLFFSLLLVNFCSLFPFIFTVTAHVILALPLALIFWLGIIIFGWLNNSSHIIAHLVPLGTPLVLINFIVIIEIARNIIRPITLSVRLTANIVAGHLLLRLLGRFSLIRLANFRASRLGLLVLVILELAVSFIQAYVFITLLTLYSTEVHYE